MAIKYQEKKPKVLDTMREKKDPCTHISCNISINQIDFEVLDHFLSPLTMCVINYAVEHIFVSVTHTKNTHRQPAA